MLGRSALLAWPRLWAWAQASLPLLPPPAGDLAPPPSAFPALGAKDDDFPDLSVAAKVKESKKDKKKKKEKQVLSLTDFLKSDVGGAAPAFGSRRGGGGDVDLLSLPTAPRPRAEGEEPAGRPLGGAFGGYGGREGEPGGGCAAVGSWPAMGKQQRQQGQLVRVLCFAVRGLCSTCRSRGGMGRQWGGTNHFSACAQQAPAAARLARSHAACRTAGKPTRMCLPASLAPPPGRQSCLPCAALHQAGAGGTATTSGGHAAGRRRTWAPRVPR